MDKLFQENKRDMHIFSTNNPGKANDHHHGLIPFAGAAFPDQTGIDGLVIEHLIFFESVRLPRLLTRCTLVV